MIFEARAMRTPASNSNNHEARAMMLKPHEFCNSYCKFLRGFRWFVRTENFLCSTSYGRW